MSLHKYSLKISFFFVLLHFRDCLDRIISFRKVLKMAYFKKSTFVYEKLGLFCVQHFRDCLYRII